MEPIVVEATRGETVEARHVVHAVAIRDGSVELAAGDPRLETFLRSSAKPIQALPVVRARPDLDDEQIALLCASHLGRPEQVSVVRRTLAAAAASEADLECGGATPIEHNCSGKHAGFIALCRAHDWPTDGYRLYGHPCQAIVRREIAAAADVDETELTAAVDGCGVPTYALSLEQIARTFARFRSLDGSARVISAMHARAEMLRGPVVADMRAVQTLDGFVAKGGAEGLFCAASPDGLGVVLKVSDGSSRAILPALEHVLSLLGVDAAGLDPGPVLNSRGEEVGALRIGSS